MQLSKLRRWHWIVVGALVGLIFGCAIGAVGTDAMVIGARASKTSQITFESELLTPPLLGMGGTTKPIVADLIIYPDGPVDLLKMRRLVNLDRRGDANSRRWAYQTWFFEARRPYSPLIGASRTDVHVKPDFPPEGYQADNDWDNADGAGKFYRDPGRHGARLSMDIAKGKYDIALRLDDPKEIASLTAKFNDHPLAPFTADRIDPHWAHTSVPPADFGAGNACVLWVGRTNLPVRIRQIHICDPTYTVRDYLDTIQAAHPTMQHYRYAWWMEPRAILGLAVGICVFVIGIIWPTVIRVLVALSRAERKPRSANTP